MPKGIYYDIRFRILVYNNHVLNNRDARWILDHCFAAIPLDGRSISLGYLRYLCRKLNNPEFARTYLLGAKRYNKTGRPTKISEFQKLHILDIIGRHNRIKQSRVRTIYYEEFNGNPNPENNIDKISLKLVRKIIKDDGQRLLRKIIKIILHQQVKN